MKISKKDTVIFFIVGIIFFIFGLWLINSLGNENEFLPVFGKLIGVGFIIFGVHQVIQYFILSQASSFKIDIKDDYLIFNDKKYSLKNSKITVEFSKKESLTRVTLRVENENKVEIVFKNLVFEDKELKEFLELIKPYLKHKNIIEDIEEKNETFRLFKDGFALNNREFYYDEIEDIKTTLIDSSGSYYLDIEIFLKSGEIIDKRLINGSNEYAKAIFAKLKHKGDIIIDCKDDKKLGIYIILAIDIITAILIYINDKFWILGGIMLFVNTFYFDYKLNSSYNLKLCQKVKELSKEEIYDIIGEVYDKTITKENVKTTI
jgi:hypothetical protein